MVSCSPKPCRSDSATITILFFGCGVSTSTHSKIHILVAVLGAFADFLKLTPGKASGSIGTTDRLPIRRVVTAAEHPRTLGDTRQGYSKVEW